MYKSYVVIKNVNLVIGDTIYSKDDELTVEEAGQENITRFLSKGYIKGLGKPAETKYYLKVDGYLEVEEINKLNKAELTEYGNHIGVPDITKYKKIQDLKDAINNFIEEQLEPGDSEDSHKETEESTETEE